MTREISDFIDVKHQAHEDGNKKLYNKIKKKLSKAMKKSRAKYTHKIQEHLADDPANAWNDIKKLTGLPPKNSNKSIDINILFLPDLKRQRLPLLLHLTQTRVRQHST